MTYNYKTTLTFFAVFITQLSSIFAQAPGGVNTSIKLWIKANSGTSSSTNNTAIGQWDDYSGSARHATQGTAGNKPLYMNNAVSNINFNPVVNFNRSSTHFMSFSTANPIVANGAGDFGIYIVSRIRSANAMTYLGHGSSANNQSINVGMETNAVSRFHTFNSAWSPSAPAMVAGAILLNTHGHNSGTRKSDINGTSIGTSGVAFSVVAGGSYLCANHNTGSTFDGEIAEMVIYQSYGAEKLKIESYLSMKYGITKAGNYQNSAGTDLWNATTNSTYHNNVTAIGRDDGSELSQLQSKSVNAGIQPIMGNASTITGLNTTHTGTFGANQSFLVWGSDNGATSFSTSYTLGTRMTRIWKAQETGTVGTVKVALLKSDIGVVSNLAFVVSNDVSFGAGDPQYAMVEETINSIVYYTTTVDLTNGQFFSFGICTAPTIASTPASGNLIWKGTTNTDWLTPSNWTYFNGSAYSTATVCPISTTDIIIPINQACVVNQPNVVNNIVNAKNIIIETGASLTLGAGTLNITGNMTNNGTYSAGTSTINFTGSTPQTISGSGTTTFYNMISNNSSTGITLNAPVIISNALTMTQGNIITSSTNLLTVGLSNTANQINWTAGTVVGPLKRWFATSINSTQASGIFPIGNSTYNRYAQINFTEAPAASGYIIGEYIAGQPGGGSGLYTGLPAVINGQNITHYEDEGFYQITPYNSAGTAYGSLNTESYDLLLRGNQLSTVSDLSKIRIIKSSNHLAWNDNPAGDGTHVTPTGTNSDFIIGATGMTGFSWFNHGAGSENALPITLTSFTANCKTGNEVSVNWSTASEQNTSYFEIQESANGIEWQVVKTVSAAGNSNHVINYYTEFSSILTGIKYYRLSQVDHNGFSKQYSIVALNCTANVSLLNLVVYPNPCKGTFNLEIDYSETEKEIDIIMMDIKGTIVYTKSISLQKGKNIFRIQDVVTTTGVYYVYMNGNGFSSNVVKIGIN